MSATTSTATEAARSTPTIGSPPAVSVEGVSKSFRLPHEQYSTLKQRMLHPRRSRSFSELHALRDVSFDVAQGEFFGIVGRNGSGKSTLLKCLAGIYGADSGRIDVHGRLSPFIELGVGFHPELSARDNVTINAIMLGLTRKQAAERFDEIIAFAELEEFVDLKLKNYSSGMSVRLGFAVAIQVDADVLLVDEVLAVGDASFQQKCFDEFDRMKAEGRTIVFVTHDMDAVRRFCDRALLLERGEMLNIGEPDAIATKYSEINFGVVGEDGPAGRPGLPRTRVARAWCETAAGPAAETARDTFTIGRGESCAACMEVEFVDAVEDPVFSITFRNDVRHTIYVARSDFDAPTGSFAAGERATVRFSFPNWLAHSTYTLTPAVMTADSRIVLDQRVDAVTLRVETNRITGGVADLPTEVEVERG
ncbi:MAG TPA: ABC transporter ATP-binding protein [Solirubrobacteraceae bacterium]|nr:ABC transporter ATP-binding protein [Solirubrobacteraceae bacterium]